MSLESESWPISLGILIGGAALPIALIMTWVYYRDKLPEPVPVVLMTLLLGGLATIPILIVEFPLAYIIGGGLDDGPSTIAQAIAISFIVAALVEELFKFSVLRFYSARHSAFDEAFDGIVYGVAASLGFALVENVLYVVGSMLEGGFMDGLGVGFARAITAVPMHASLGVIMGAGIGLGRTGKGAAWTMVGLLVAIFLHGMYDSFILSMNVQDPESVSNAWIMFCLVGFLATTVFSIAVAGLLIARFRSKQVVQAPPTGNEPIESMPGATGDNAASPGGVPILPLLSLVLAALAAGLPLATMLIGIAGMDQSGDVDEGLLVIMGLAFMGGVGCSALLFPLSITSICIQPRWKAASILGLVVSIGVLFLSMLLVVAS